VLVGLLFTDFWINIRVNIFAVQGGFLRADRYITHYNLSRQAEKWMAEIKSSSAPRKNFKLKKERCALLIMDMNNYFASPSGRCYLPASEAVIHNIRLLLNHWRSFGGTVVFTRHGHAGSDADEGALFKKFFTDYIKKEEPDANLIAELEPFQSEKIVDKSTYDAFLNSDLGEYLAHKNIFQVLIAGVLTHMCVETTARSAFCRGFEVYIPIDATAADREFWHVNSLKSMARSVAIPLTVKEVCSL
jgi:nicotinamidase-related amidase